MELKTDHSDQYGIHFSPSSLCPLNCGGRMLSTRWWLWPRTNTGVSLPCCTLFLHSWGLGSPSLKYPVVCRAFVTCMFRYNQTHVCHMFRPVLVLVGNICTSGYLKMFSTVIMYWSYSSFLSVFPILPSLLSFSILSSVVPKLFGLLHLKMKPFPLLIPHHNFTVVGKGFRYFVCVWMQPLKIGQGGNLRILNYPVVYI